MGEEGVIGICVECDCGDWMFVVVGDLDVLCGGW